MTEMQNLALELFQTLDSICQRKLQNPITRGFWNKIAKPFGINSINNTHDDELKKDLNEMYYKFKIYFENKQLKDLLDEGNRMSGINLQELLNNNQLKQVSKYF